jgi:hypothetical protein
LFQPIKTESRLAQPNDFKTVASLCLKEEETSRVHSSSSFLGFFAWQFLTYGRMEKKRVFDLPT